MRERLQKIGRVKLVCVITILAVILAVASNLLISAIFDFQTSLFEDVFRASLVPVLIAPILSWHLVGTFYKLDILEKEMSRLAKVDGLTSVCNRRFFYQQASDWLSNGLNHDKSYAFFVLDMDFFKGINDCYGHICGDKVLEVFGRILKVSVLTPSMIGRLGGEEFAIFVPNMAREAAECLAKKICQTVRARAIEHDGEQVSCSVSIGVSININGPKSMIESAFKYADLALYEAKNSGRDCYRLYVSE